MQLEVNKEWIQTESKLTLIYAIGNLITFCHYQRRGNLFLSTKKMVVRLKEQRISPARVLGQQPKVSFKLGTGWEGKIMKYYGPVWIGLLKLIYWDKFCDTV